MLIKYDMNLIILFSIKMKEICLKNSKDGVSSLEKIW